MAHIIHVDRWRTRRSGNRAAYRVFYAGRRRNLQVQRFATPGTIEDRIDLGVCAVERCRLLAGLVGRQSEPQATISGLVSGNGGSWNNAERHYFNFCRHLPRFKTFTNFTAGTLGIAEVRRLADDLAGGGRGIDPAGLSDHELIDPVRRTSCARIHGQRTD